MSDWVILETRGRSTLRLAESLTRVGITAWSPSRVKNGKVPKRRARVVLREAICAPYVFAAAIDQRRLRELEIFPGSLPRFDLFRDGSGIPVIPDSQLDALRAYEAREDLKVRRRERHTWQTGQRARVAEGSAEGHEGTITAIRGAFVTLTVEGQRHPLKIGSWLLEEVSLESQRIAA